MDTHKYIESRKEHKSHKVDDAYNEVLRELQLKDKTRWRRDSRKYIELEGKVDLDKLGKKIRNERLQKRTSDTRQRNARSGKTVINDNSGCSHDESADCQCLQPDGGPNPG